MGVKISISLTDEHACLAEDAGVSGDYVSSSEVIREALRDWRSKRLLGRLWDEGIASGRADQDESIEDIKRAARHGPPTTAPRSLHDDAPVKLQGGDPLPHPPCAGGRH